MTEQMPEGLLAYFRDAPIDKIREDLREKRLTLLAETLAYEEIRRRTGKSRIDDPSPLPPLPARPPRAESDAGVDRGTEGPQQVSPEEPADDHQSSAFETLGEVLKVLVWIGFIGFILYWVLLFVALACWGPDHAVCKF